MNNEADAHFVNKLREFYDTGHLQQKVSFWVSMLAIIIGFIVILISVSIFLYNPDKITNAVVICVSGVLTEFISAAFFYIHNRNLTQLNIYFEKLIKLQDTELAIALVDKMPENNRAFMYMSIINVLILRNEPQREITPELVAALRKSN